MKLVVLTTAALLVAGGIAHAAPLEAYGKLPSMDNVSISPDGAKVAFAQQVGGKYTVVVDQLNPAAVVIEIAPTSQKIRALVWADASHLLIVRSQTADVGSNAGYARGEWAMVQSLDLTARKATQLFTRLQHGSALNSVTTIPQARTMDGHLVVFGSGVLSNLGGSVLLAADLTTGFNDTVRTNGSMEAGHSWIIGDRGNLVARSRYDQFRHTWTLQLDQGGHWTDVYSTQATVDMPDALGVTWDGASVLLETIGTGGAAERRLVSLPDGRISDPQPQYQDFSDWLYDRQTNRIVGAVKQGMEPSYVFFDPKLQAAWALAQKSFPDEQVDPVGWSDDRTKVVVKVSGARHGIVYEVLDLATNKAMQIGAAYAGITPDDVADVQIVSYKAKDGLQIQGFLTLPTGREPKNMPLVVLPHGGPADHDEGGFDWLAQALASRGYAVLQPEFRGSAGLGQPLEQAGYGEFGRKMQSDLSDGVKALAAAGYIDPKRVCIVGGSYGGYAALAGVTLEQGVYRCAVSIAGISEVHKLVDDGRVLADRSSSVRYWDRYVGAKGPSDGVFDQISPAKHAAEASAPILLIHGKDDVVVPWDQSQAMETALKRANKPVEFVLLDKGDHWMLEENVRLQTLQDTVSFLEKNNPPK